MITITCTDVQLALLEGNASTALLEHAHACRKGCRLVLKLSGLLNTGSNEASAVSTGSLPKGRILDRYELEHVIGHGGQGVVCRARDLKVNEPVAIKFLPLEHHNEEVLELKLARRVTHPNVCRVHDTQTYGRNRLIIMEHVAGPSLAESSEKLSHGERLRIFQGICAGVHAAHEAGVLHLDLTPNNVLLRGGKEPVVTDFGLSVALEDGARALGGTTGYMAPEQHHSGVDRRTDVYALGHLLRTLVGGESRRIRQVIRQATHTEPERRYATVAELAKAVSPRLRWQRLWSVPFVVATGGVAALSTCIVRVPPAGPRAEWHEELWGHDIIPRSAWNVARKHGTHEAATTEFSHPLFACGNKPHDLFDGHSSYYQWGRGIAFPPAPTRRSPKAFCVDLALMGECGSLSPHDIICEDLNGSLDSGHRVLPLHGSDIDLANLSREQANTMGKLVPRVACGERWVKVRLDRITRIFAVRLWFHDPPPRAWRVAVEGPKGTTTTQSDKLALRLTESDYALMHLVPNQLNFGNRYSYHSVPLTVDFPTTYTRAVTIFFDTCTSISTNEFQMYEAGAAREDGNDYEPEIGWLYEIEVFAEVDWHDAWSWHLLSD